MARRQKLGSLGIGIDADDREFRLAAERTIAGLKRTQRQFHAAQRRARTYNRTVTSLTSSVRRLAAAYISFRAAGAFLGAVEETTRLQNRLRLVTDTTRELNETWAHLAAIAQESRAPLAATIDLYQRLATALEDSQTSYRDTLLVVRAVQRAAAISGSSVQATEAAIVQFGQAVASGVLRGQELNSVLEQMPRLARAIADGMGITIGQIREFAKQGALVNRVTIPAILSQTKALEEEFSRTARTIGQAWQQLENSFINILHESNEEVSELTRSINSTIDSIREAIESPGFIVALKQMVGLMADLAFAARTLLHAYTGIRNYLFGESESSAGAAKTVVHVYTPEIREGTREIERMHKVVGELVARQRELQRVEALHEMVAREDLRRSLEDQLEAIKKVVAAGQEQWMELGHTMESSIENAFTNMITDMEDFRSHMENLVNEIIREIVRITIAQRAAGAIVGWIGGAFNLPLATPPAPTTIGAPVGPSTPAGVGVGYSPYRAPLPAVPQGGAPGGAINLDFSFRPHVEAGMTAAEVGNALGEAYPEYEARIRAMLQRELPHPGRLRDAVTRAVRKA